MAVSLQAQVLFRKDLAVPTVLITACSTVHACIIILYGIIFTTGKLQLYYNAMKYNCFDGEKKDRKCWFSFINQYQPDYITIKQSS